MRDNFPESNYSIIVYLSLFIYKGLLEVFPSFLDYEAGSRSRLNQAISEIHRGPMEMHICCYHGCFLIGKDYLTLSIMVSKI